MGWGLALAPAADHTRLECTDVSLGGSNWPQAPPSSYPFLAEEETGAVQGCRAVFLLVWGLRCRSSRWSYVRGHPGPRAAPDLWFVGTSSVSASHTLTPHLYVFPSLPPRPGM